MLVARDIISFHIVFMCVFMAAFVPFSARAGDKIKFFNEDNITAFIEEMTAVSSGENLIFSPDEVVEYLDKHLHKKSHFKSEVKYDIPGFAAQSATLKFDKKEFIENITKGAESMSDYEINIEILDIKISRKRDKATIRTVGYENGTIPVATGDGTEFVPVEGESSCIQILSLEKGVIQMLNANCATVMKFSGM